jgi:hypothetical protein
MEPHRLTPQKGAELLLECLASVMALLVGVVVFDLRHSALANRGSIS